MPGPNAEQKKIPKSVTLQTSHHLGNLCEHMHTLYGNIEVVTSLFPEYFCQPSEEEGEEEESDVPVIPATMEEANHDDMFCTNIVSGVSFNTQSGLWECECWSQHQPKQMNDPQLVDSTAQRLTYIRKDNLSGGLYVGPDLKPSVVKPNGEPKNCPCGAGFNIAGIVHCNYMYNILLKICMFLGYICTLLKVSSLIIMAVHFLIPTVCFA